MVYDRLSEVLGNKGTHSEIQRPYLARHFEMKSLKASETRPLGAEVRDLQAIVW